MPYIERSRRIDLAQGAKPQTAGELNYAITLLIRDYVQATGGPSYTWINAAVGALECAKLELYRRIAVPYEDHKIGVNGDVYHDFRPGADG